MQNPQFGVLAGARRPSPMTTCSSAPSGCGPWASTWRSRRPWCRSLSRMGSRPMGTQVRLRHLPACGKPQAPLQHGHLRLQGASVPSAIRLLAGIDSDRTHIIRQACAPGTPAATPARDGCLMRADDGPRAAKRQRTAKAPAAIVLDIEGTVAPISFVTEVALQIPEPCSILSPGTQCAGELAPL